MPQKRPERLRQKKPAKRPTETSAWTESNVLRLSRGLSDYRFRLMETLKEKLDPKAVPHLITFLRASPFSAERRQAAFWLGKLKATQANPTLISLLVKEKDRNVRRVIGEVLTNFALEKASSNNAKYRKLLFVSEKSTSLGAAKRGLFLQALASNEKWMRQIPSNSNDPDSRKMEFFLSLKRDIAKRPIEEIVDVLILGK